MKKDIPDIIKKYTPEQLESWLRHTMYVSLSVINNNLERVELLSELKDLNSKNEEFAPKDYVKTYKIENSQCWTDIQTHYFTIRPFIELVVLLYPGWKSWFDEAPQRFSRVPEKYRLPEICTCDGCSPSEK